MGLSVWNEGRLAIGRSGRAALSRISKTGASGFETMPERRSRDAVAGRRPTDREPDGHTQRNSDMSTDGRHLLPDPRLPHKPPGVRLGIGLTSPSPELAQICANAGFDMVLIDMEHGPISIETAYRMVTALAGTRAQAWIRVASNDATQIKLALDTGAQTVLVPMVTTREEAERAVSASKYPPKGIRGWGPFLTQHQWKTDMLDYARRANEETDVVVLIEHPRAIENIDEILAVEGLGGAIAAPFDLAVNMGFSDGPAHPEVQDAMAHASKKIVAKGFPLISMCVTPEQARTALSKGCTLLFLGFDTMFVPAAVHNYLSLLAQAGDSGGPG
jgi:2-keto-3-deoxy-L-rhamnonate aldolase RhmA